MNKSDSIANLAAALAKAQAEFKPAELNSTNPFLKNKFADLGAVIEAARPALAKNGLSVIQFPVGGGTGIGLETIIAHESGEWMSETVYLALTEERGKSPAQVAGSLITYLRRYALSSALGIYAGDDTDGTAHNTATQQTTPRAAPQPERAPLPEMKLPPQVQIPSRQNGNGKTAQVKTAKWEAVIKRAVSAGYVSDDNAAPHRLLHVVAGAGINEITDDNLKDVWAVIKDHYETSKAVEVMETETAR